MQATERSEYDPRFRMALILCSPSLIANILVAPRMQLRHARRTHDGTENKAASSESTSAMTRAAFKAWLADSCEVLTTRILKSFSPVPND
jgi:hypothetical protein